MEARAGSSLSVRVFGVDRVEYAGLRRVWVWDSGLRVLGGRVLGVAVFRAQGPQGSKAKAVCQAQGPQRTARRVTVAHLYLLNTPRQLGFTHAHKLCHHASSC